MHSCFLGGIWEHAPLENFACSETNSGAIWGKGQFKNLCTVSMVMWHGKVLKVS